MKKRVIAVAMLLVVVASLLASCAGSSNLPDLNGYYHYDSYDFDIGALEFYPDGTVDLSMDWEYTGKWKKSGDHYVITITGGKSAVSGLLAKERNDSMKITATPIDNGKQLIVSIKAKSGYMYFGKESATFRFDGSF